MVGKQRAPVEGVPDLSVDKTFAHLVVGLAQCSDVRTVSKYLQGEEVGRSALEREMLGGRLLKATKRAVELRRESDKMKDVPALLAKMSNEERQAFREAMNGAPIKTSDRGKTKKRGSR